MDVDVEDGTDSVEVDIVPHRMMASKVTSWSGLSIYALGTSTAIVDDPNGSGIMAGSAGFLIALVGALLWVGDKLVRFWQGVRVSNAITQAQIEDARKGTIGGQLEEMQRQMVVLQATVDRERAEHLAAADKAEKERLALREENAALHVKYDEQMVRFAEHTQRIIELSDQVIEASRFNEELASRGCVVENCGLRRRPTV